MISANMLFIADISLLGMIPISLMILDIIIGIGIATILTCILVYLEKRTFEHPELNINDAS